MSPTQIARYNALMKRREQLMNFIYVSDFAIFVNNGILLDAAVEQAKKSILEIDQEIARI